MNNQVLRRLGGMSLAWKLSLLYVFLLFIPVLVASRFIAQRMTDALSSDEVARGRLEIQRMSDTAVRSHRACWHAIQFIQTNRPFIDGLDPDLDYDTAGLMAFQRDPLAGVEAVRVINTDFLRLRVYVVNEQLFEFYPTIVHESRVVREPWYATLMESPTRLLLQFGLTDPETGHETVALSYRLTDMLERTVGIARIEMLAGRFFGHTHDDGQDARRLLVVRHAGEVHLIGATDNALANLHATGEFLELFQRVARDGADFVTETSIGSVVFNYAALPALKAELALVTSMDRFDHQNRTLGLQVLAGSFLLYSALSAATVLIVRLLMKKLRTIVSIMRRVAHGELVVEIPDLGDDEIGELGRHFAKMLSKINGLIHTVYHEQIAARDAEIRSLNSQINAHFIYNVLESVKMEAIVTDRPVIADALTALGRIMRYGMDWRRESVTLADEIAHASDYLELMNFQREFPIDVEFNVEAVLRDVPMPKMILQPLAENSVNHGLKLRKRGARIAVSACLEEHTVVLRVQDNGSGIDKDRLEEIRGVLKTADGIAPINGSGSGIGLESIAQRATLHYGSGFNMEISSIPWVSTETVIRFRAPDDWLKGGDVARAQIPRG